MQDDATFPTTHKDTYLQLIEWGLPIVDTRLKQDFVEARISGSVNIPFDASFDYRVFELPPRHHPLVFVCAQSHLLPLLIYLDSRSTPWTIAAILVTASTTTGEYHTLINTKVYDSISHYVNQSERGCEGLDDSIYSKLFGAGEESGEGNQALSSTDNSNRNNTHSSSPTFIKTGNKSNDCLSVVNECKVGDQEDIRSNKKRPRDHPLSNDVHDLSSNNVNDKIPLYKRQKRGNTITGDHICATSSVTKLSSNDVPRDIDNKLHASDTTSETTIPTPTNSNRVDKVADNPQLDKSAESVPIAPLHTASASSSSSTVTSGISHQSINTQTFSISHVHSSLSPILHYYLGEDKSTLALDSQANANAPLGIQGYSTDRPPTCAFLLNECNNITIYTQSQLSDSPSLSLPYKKPLDEWLRIILPRLKYTALSYSPHYILLSSTSSSSNHTDLFDSIDVMTKRGVERGLPVASRVLFQPCPALLEHIDSIERTLLQEKLLKFTSAKDQLDGEEGKNRPAQVTFRALDVGCGQGRDSIWLLLRGNKFKSNNFFDSNSNNNVNNTSRGTAIASGSTSSTSSLHRITDAPNNGATFCASPPLFFPSSPSSASLPSWQWNCTCVDDVPQLLTNLKNSCIEHGIVDRLCLSRSKIRADGTVVIKWTESSERRQEEKMEVSEATATSTVTTESTVTSERHGNTQKQAQPSQEQCPQQVVQKQQQGGSSASTSSNIPGWIDQQYDLVLIVRFHHVGFLPKLVSLIAPGGYIVYSHFYEGAAHPTNLVMKGQLASVFTPEQGFDIIEDSVRLFGDGRPLTHFIARKRPM